MIQVATQTKFQMVKLGLSILHAVTDLKGYYETFEMTLPIKIQ